MQLSIKIARESEFIRRGDLTKVNRIVDILVKILARSREKKASRFLSDNDEKPYTNRLNTPLALRIFGYDESVRCYCPILDSSLPIMKLMSVILPNIGILIPIRSKRKREHYSRRGSIIIHKCELSSRLFTLEKPTELLNHRRICSAHIPANGKEITQSFIS